MQRYEKLQALLDERRLPPLRSKAVMMDIMQKEVYGYMPPAPTKVEWEKRDSLEMRDLAGKATTYRVDITSYWGEKKFTFTVSAVIPKGEGPFPFFVHINFRPNVPDAYMPSEEITDNGYAVLSFCYKDVTDDAPGFDDGICGVFYGGKSRGPHDPGKIAFWAWAAQRVMDYAQSLPVLDKSRAIVCGHSRLGKTALLCGATDERFRMAYANNSGCNGAAITRDKVGEIIKDSLSYADFWYCESFRRHEHREHEMPFDQHYLLSSIAPRFVYVASAAEDTWADPDSEMLCCVAATPFYNEMGLDGIVCNDRLPKPGDVYHDGNIGYHLRYGTHFFSREDWQKAIAFANKKFN